MLFCLTARLFLCHCKLILNLEKKIIESNFYSNLLNLYFPKTFHF